MVGGQHVVYFVIGVLLGHLVLDRRVVFEVLVELRVYVRRQRGLLLLLADVLSPLVVLAVDLVVEQGAQLVRELPHELELLSFPARQSRTEFAQPLDALLLLVDDFLREPGVRT